MTYKHIYAIPDIHGRYDRLEAALQLIDKDGYDPKEDMIVFLGDYIDRGPDSKKVIEKIKYLVDNGTAMAVQGNHENFAISYYSGTGDRSLWLCNGGQSTLISYSNEYWISGHLGQMDKDHVKFIGSLPTSIELQGFFFSHSPVPREKHRSGTGRNPDYGRKGDPYTKWELTWYYFGEESEMDGGMMDKHEGPKSQKDDAHLIGICGHIHRLPDTVVRIFPKYRMLDAGCGCSPKAPLAIHECVSNRTFYAT